MVAVQFDDCIITDRGGIVENRHLVHAAIVDANGKLLYAVGDPLRVTLARSAAKPAQALAILESGGFEKFDFNDADLALICASHNSEDRHISRARAMLAKVQAKEEDLRCGGHAALSDAVNKEWVKADYAPTGISNNCSGKHVGMLAGAKALKAEISEYHLPHNPMQLHVKRAIEELSNLDANELKWAVDGCNLPAPAMPLSSLGRLYGSFAAAVDEVEKDSSPSKRSLDLARIFHAMVQYPECVGGEGRFCTRLMTTYQQGLIGKLGAEGCYGIGIRPTEQTRKLGTNAAVGIAIKIEDGSIPILYSAVMEILQQLQIGSPDMRKELADFHHPPLLNTAGLTIGRVSHAINQVLILQLPGTPDPLRKN
ncbi:L-asparaginase II [Aspergillus floccosus]